MQIMSRWHGNTRVTPAIHLDRFAGKAKSVHSPKKKKKVTDIKVVNSMARHERKIQPCDC